jgi:propanol-preferring alcohol dehydrogenase
VGQFSLQFAKLTGAKVTAVDPSTKQLKVAEELGAHAALHPSEVDEHVKDHRPDIVMLHTPAQSAIDKAVQVVRNKGKILWAIVGQMPLNPGGEVDVVTSMAGSKADIAEVLRLAKQKKIRVRAEGYPLSQGVDILRRLKRGEIVGRAVVTA